MSNKEFEAAKALAESDRETRRKLLEFDRRVDAVERKSVELEKHQRETDRQLHELSLLVGRPNCASRSDLDNPGFPHGGTLHA